MNIEWLSSKFAVRYLTSDDVDIIYNLSSDGAAVVIYNDKKFEEFIFYHFLEVYSCRQIHLKNI